MNSTRSAKLALITFLLAFVVILLGAYTRLTDAGLSCPDWPHCFGYLTAPHTSSQLAEAASKYPQAMINVKKAWTEMIHRYFAGTEGILILILSYTILASRKATDLKSVVIATLLIILLLVQVTLGMLTVTEKLKPIIVLSHLMTGLSILSVLWWSYIDLYFQDNSGFRKSAQSYLPWLIGGLVLIIGQITLGGWVSTHYAGLACIDFPYCNGKVLPAIQWHQLNSDLISIHMLHRIGALVTASYLGILALCLLTHSTFRAIALFVLALLLLQVTLGVLNIVMLRPVGIAMIHHLVAILLLLTLITALAKATYFTGKPYGSRFA